MTKLQFGDYIFPHNPKIFELTSSLNTVSYTLPYLGTGFQLIAAKPRLISLEGEFFAESAAEAAQLCGSLEAVFSQRKRGMLFLPFQKPFYAIFSELATSHSGDGKIISYRAKFLEDMLISQREASYD